MLRIRAHGATSRGIAALALIASTLAVVVTTGSPPVAAQSANYCRGGGHALRNGSFEVPAALTAGRNDVDTSTLPTGTVYGWRGPTSTFAVYSGTSPAGTAAQGLNFLELNPTGIAAGDYHQFINTAVGDTIGLAFSTRSLSGTDSLDVLAGPAGGPYTPVTTVTATTSWVSHTALVTATTGATEIRFRIGDPSLSQKGGLYLDDVAFSPTGACDDSVIFKAPKVYVTRPGNYNPLANDFGVDARIISVGTPTESGNPVTDVTVTITPDGKQLRIDPGPNANSDDVAIPYTMTALGGFTSSAEFHIYISPVPVDDRYDVYAGQTTPLPVLTNELGKGLSVNVISTPPNHGTAVVPAQPGNDHIDYTPSPGYVGADTFWYTLLGPGWTSQINGRVNVNVLANADLAVAAGATTPATVHQGEGFTLPLTVTNNGPVGSASPKLTIDLPTGVSFVSGNDCVAGPPVTCTYRGNLANAASHTFDLELNAADAGGPQDIDVSVSSTTADLVSTNDATTFPLTVGPSADVATGPGSVTGSATPGSPITWTVPVRNDGPSTATGVTVDLTYVGSAITGVAVAVDGNPVVCTTLTVDKLRCPVPDLASGATATVSATGNLDAGATIANLLFVSDASSTAFDPDGADNVAVWGATTNPQADIAVTGSLLTGGTIVPGGPIAFRYSVTNTGPSTAFGAILSVQLPPEVGITSAPAGCTIDPDVVACDLGDIAPGGTSGDIDLSGTTTPAASGAIQVLGSAGSGTTDPDTSDNDATVPATVTPSADVAVSLSSSPTQPGGGGPEQLTLTVENLGPSEATGVSVDVSIPSGLVLDPLPSGCSGGAPAVTCTVATLGAGGDTAFRLTGTWTQASAGSTRAFTATRVASTPVDLVAADDTANLSVSVVSLTDLEVIGGVSPNPLVAGNPGQLGIVVVNRGPSDLPSGATVVIALPPGVTAGAGLPADCAATPPGSVTCTVGQVPNGGQQAFTIPVSVASNYAGPPSFTATTTPPAGAVDPNPTNDSLTFDDSKPLADVQIAGVPALSIPGLAATALFGIGNAGPSDVSDITVVVDVPAGYALPPTTPGCTTRSATQLECHTGALAAGRFTIVVVSAVPPADATGTATMSATIDSGGYIGPSNGPVFVDGRLDLDTSNDAATVALVNAAYADMVVTGTAPASITAGTLAPWGIDVTNPGPSVSPSGTVTLALSAGTAFVQATGATCTATGLTVTCALGSLAPGATQHIDLVTAEAADITAASVTVSAVTTANEVDAANNSVTLTAGTGTGTGAGSGGAGDGGAGDGTGTGTGSGSGSGSTGSGGTGSTSGGTKLAETGADSRRVLLLGLAVLAAGLALTIGVGARRRARSS